MQLIARYGFTLILIVLLTFVWVFHGFATLTLPDSVTVTISFILLVLPGGILAHGILNPDSWSWTRFVGFGFPISIAIVGLISLPVRTLHLSMTHIALALYIISAVGVLWARWRYDDFGLMTLFNQKIDRVTGFYAVVALGIVLVFAIVAPYTMRKTNDILLHSAEITYYAGDVPLTWEEIYFDSGNQVWERVSLAIWRLAQGVITWSSDVHVFLSQLTVTSMLMIYLGFAIFLSSRLFNFSVRDSLMIVIIFFGMLTLLPGTFQAGSEIFSRVIRDKVLDGYGFLPILFGICYYILQSPTWRSYLLFALTLIGSIFTHPILTGFMLMVLGVWMGFNILLSRRLRPFLLIILIGGIIFAPLVFIRFTTDQAFNFGEDSIDENDRIWLDEETQLYAVNPEMVGSVGYFLVIAGAIVGVVRFRKDEIARFYLATVVVVGLALIPYTAWLYGSLVSVYHINRALWVLMHGLLVWYLIITIAGYVRRYLPFEWKPAHAFGTHLAIIGLVVIGIVPFVVGAMNDTAMKSDEEMAFQQELIAVGEYIEAQTDNPVIVTGFHDYLRAISHLVKPVTFCKPVCMIAFTNISEEEARIRHNFRYRFHNEFDGYDNEKRISELNNYNVDYILVTPGDDVLEPLFEAYPENFEVVLRTASINLVHYTPSDNNT